MTTASHPAPFAQPAPAAGPAPGPATVARGTCVGLGAAITATGVILGVLTLITAPPLVRLLIEIGLALAVAVPGALIAKVGIGGRHPLDVGVLLPEIVLAGALIYLAVAMPFFHAAKLPYGEGVGQLLTVLVGLVLGSVGLVLAGATSPRASEVGRVSFPLAVRDGVILIVGTIIVAIGIGQFAMPKLTPPMWSWISFGAITVPGMLLLIAREMVKQVLRRHPGARSLPGLVLTEVMLVVGLFAMIFGSIANLTLGKNGYVAGFVGNTTGVAVLLVAAMFLVVIRGAAKPIARGHDGRLGLSGAVLFNLILAVGVIAFFDGERSLITGKTPVPSFGAAFPAAVLIAIAGLLILIPGRVLAGTDAAAATAADPDAADPATAGAAEHDATHQNAADQTGHHAAGRAAADGRAPSINTLRTGA